MATPNPALLKDLAISLLQEEAQARDAAALGKPRGPKTGFKRLDREIGGFLAPGLHTALAAPGAGKTALALQVGAQCGFPCLFVTSEMRPVELLRRTVARESGAYLGRLRGGELPEAALKQHIATAAKAVPMLAIFDATGGEDCGPAKVQQAAADLKAAFDSPHILVVLDSLTDWAAMLAGDLTEYQANEQALNSLKTMSANLNCPILVIAHKNRGGQRAEGAEAMFVGKGTGRIEYLSESLWNLAGEGNAEPDLNGDVRKKLTLVKNRHGVPGATVDFLFEGRTQKFQEF